MSSNELLINFSRPLNADKTIIIAAVPTDIPAVAALVTPFDNRRPKR
jgi:hypothetical protein